MSEGTLKVITVSLAEYATSKERHAHIVAVLDARSRHHEGNWVWDLTLLVQVP